MKHRFLNISNIDGEISLPGDKSISHRALIFSALAEGRSSISNLANSEDVKRTIKCFKALSIKIEKQGNKFIIKGAGRNGFLKPDNPLYCGNSGTTARLLSGVLAVQYFRSQITGDKSLSQRPMKRIIDPLEKMGCRIKSNNGYLPLQFFPEDNVEAINYSLPIASAQVKGATLLAGLHFEDKTKVVEENSLSRDHTERMLGLPVDIIGNTKTTTVSSSYYPAAREYFVPGDISTAAFFIVLTLLIKNSSLLLKNISLNETRKSFLHVLINMGADIKIEKIGESCNEPYGDIYVRSSELKNIEIMANIIPGIIDEIPILSIAGVFAEGNFKISGAKELRVKESDRIKSVTMNLKKAGLDITENEDGFSVKGNLINEMITFESYRDHRIAMAFSVLSCLMKEGSLVNNFECVNVSNPQFLDQLVKIKAQ
jgi:3-phosphoshikimate 1-carboxyvinyltransferase